MNHPAQHPAERVIKWTELFAEYQTPDGSVDLTANETGVAYVAFEQITEAYYQLCADIGQGALNYYDIFHADAVRWRQNGLQNSPNFLNTHEYWKPPTNDDTHIPFLGPIRIPNGIKGTSFIFNFALFEPSPLPDSEVVEAATNHITVMKQDIPLLEAPHRTIGYSGGDGSVLFSELLSSERRRGPQTFGAFILSDFKRRFETISQRPDISFGTSLRSILIDTAPTEPSRERGTWLLIHDRFHEIGDLPHSEHLASKMNFATAVLDELKADGSAYLALRTISPDWANAGTRHLADKMLRFPFSPYAYNSVDGAVGELFLKQALRSSSLYIEHGKLEINLPRLDNCIENLVSDALAVEANKKTTTGYITHAKRYLHETGIALPPNRRPLNWHNLTI